MIRNCVVNASLCNIDVFFFPVIVQDWYFFHNIVLSRNSFKFIFPLCSTCSDVFQLVAYPPPPLPPKENRDSIIEIMTSLCIDVCIDAISSFIFVSFFSLLCDLFVAQYVRIFFHIIIYYYHSYYYYSTRVITINNFSKAKLLILFFTQYFYSLVIISASSYYDFLKWNLCLIVIVFNVIE